MKDSMFFSEIGLILEVGHQILRISYGIEDISDILEHANEILDQIEMDYEGYGINEKYGINENLPDTPL